MPATPGRPIAECIGIARVYEERLGYAPIPDEDFAKDVEAGIEAHREPLDVSAWVNRSHRRTKILPLV